jgi:hypothetical protein
MASRGAVAILHQLTVAVVLDDRPSPEGAAPLLAELEVAAALLKPAGLLEWSEVIIQVDLVPAKFPAIPEGSMLSGRINKSGKNGPGPEGPRLLDSQPLDLQNGFLRDTREEASDVALEVTPLQTLGQVLDHQVIGSGSLALSIHSNLVLTHLLFQAADFMLGHLQLGSEPGKSCGMLSLEGLYCLLHHLLRVVSALAQLKVHSPSDLRAQCRNQKRHKVDLQLSSDLWQQGWQAGSDKVAKFSMRHRRHLLVGFTTWRLPNSRTFTCCLLTRSRRLICVRSQKTGPDG